MGREPASFALRDRGRQRPVNQDQTIATPLPGDALLLAVADGVGGARAGEVASEETVRTLVASLTERLQSGTPGEALAQAVSAANARVMELSTGEASFSGMATTLVAVLVQGGAAHIANIGDSRAYRFRQGVVEALTVDDSWVEEQVRLGTLTRDEAERSPYRNAITRGIGIEDTITVEVSEVPLEAGDVLLLCSDGLYRMVDEATMGRVLAGTSAERAAYRLVDLANEAGGIDNISVAIYRHG